MDATPVVTCFLRHRSDVLLLRRSDEVGSYPGRWGGVAGHVADDEGRDRDPEAAARAELGEEAGVDDATLVRAGEPFEFADGDYRWRVHPFLFEVDDRAVETHWETAEHEWVPPTAIRRRETVPALWTSYDRVRPRVATVREDREHGSSWLSIRALEVLRDEAAAAVEGRKREAETTERERVADGDGGSGDADGTSWDGLAAVAAALLDARPSMAVVANRVNQAMYEAGDDRTPAAVERAASDGIDRAYAADERAAAAAAEQLPDRLATLSRSGTVRRALAAADPEAVLVAESRPGREGVGVAESLAGDCEVTLTTDAAFPAELARREAGALVVGADRLLPDGRVVNKVGTRAAALAAPAACPCYVVTASAKVATDERIDREERDPAEVYDGDAPVSVANPTFDVTPAEAVTVVTEDGPLDAAGVGAVAERHREWAQWRER
ncbi:NUDIX domain-containing protein [Halomicrobium salinisoli]|uniref:NUDIX domain-containing protein n=1 Tax=Halomicrobium salinisoli TaxID=2878391 RepID=UPI001CF004B8|nr:NUDIX domain-containing protein [Halomicrobium salinisoli]